MSSDDAEKELILNVSNLEDNFDKIVSYERRRAEEKYRWRHEIKFIDYWSLFVRASHDQHRLSQLSLYFPDEDDINIPHLPNKNMRFIPYHLPSWSGMLCFLNQEQSDLFFSFKFSLVDHFLNANEWFRKHWWWCWQIFEIFAKNKTLQTIFAFLCALWLDSEPAEISVKMIASY